MSALEIIKWMVCILMLIGWACMNAANCLPDQWAWLTIAVVSILFGLSPIVAGAKAVGNGVKKVAQSIGK